MKRFILFISAVFIFISTVMISCKKNYITTDTQQLQALTDTFSISASDTSWKWNSNGYFAYKDSLPNLATYDTTGAESANTNINDSGAVFIYFSTDTGKSYQMLPALNINGYNFSGISSDATVEIQAAPVSVSTKAAPDFLINIKVVSIPSIIGFKTLNFSPQDYRATMKALHLNK